MLARDIILIVLATVVYIVVKQETFTLVAPVFLGNNLMANKLDIIIRFH